MMRAFILLSCSDLNTRAKFRGDNVAEIPIDDDINIMQNRLTSECLILRSRGSK